MTDAPTPPDSGTLPALPAPAPTRWDWRPKLRWFASEYLIVVLGVLTAVALNAWWQARADRATEQTHLRQLASDLDATERRMSHADSLSLPMDRAGDRLWAAFYTDPPPPRDSVLWWRIRSYGYLTDARPLLGTAEALIATGDLALVRDDSLRAGLVAYVEETRSEMEDQARLNAQWQEARTLLDRGIDNGEIGHLVQTTAPERFAALREANPTFDFPEAPRLRFPLQTERLFEDRDMAQAAWTMRNAKSGLWRSRARIRQHAAALRQRVGAQIER